MKKIIAFTIVVLVLIIMQQITFLQWWIFLVPIFFLGLLLPFEKWKVSSFRLGFFAGFSVWLLSTLYFEMVYEGHMINLIGEMMNLPYFLVYIIIGFLGGILTGLSLYSGFLLKRGKTNL